MVDFLELMRTECSREVIEFQINQDKGPGYMQYWPDPEDTTGRFQPAGCRIAVLGYQSAQITGAEDERWIDDFMREAWGFYEKSPPEVQDAFISAIRSLLTSARRRPVGLQEFLARVKVDLRPELSVLYPQMPTVEQAQAEGAYEAQLFYLVYWHEPGALQRLEELIATSPGPERTMDLLREIDGWNLPGREKILQNYINDGRQVRDVNGNPGVAVADQARVILGMFGDHYNGPKQLTDEQGRPITPRSAAPRPAMPEFPPGTNSEPR